MKPIIRFALVVMAFAIALSSKAYPPAPHHLFYGIVRDEYGNPLEVTDASLILETTAGVRVTTPILPFLEPGINYRLEAPMDSGLTADPYIPTALHPAVPFRITVRIGGTIYLPIEMAGDFAHLGEPGRQTHLNLTLGEDADGDGIPDAWERQINPDISQVDAGGDGDRDGMSNLAEYLAGTYAFDPDEGFKLSMAGINGARAVLEFTAIRGRTYSLLHSNDLDEWTFVPFQVEGEENSIFEYQATDVRKLRIEAENAPDSSGNVGLFRLMVR